jgi:hypothetical protein
MQNLLYSQISNLVMKSAGTLEESLADFLLTGGRQVLPAEVQIYVINNINGFSGYNYWVDDALIGQLHIATLNNGNFCLYRRIYENHQVTERFDYFDQKGNFLNSTDMQQESLLNYFNIIMEAACPIVNHFYNVLHVEYSQTNSGQSKSDQIFTLESILKTLYKDPTKKLGARSSVKDVVYKNLRKQILAKEMDPVLKWKERQVVFETYKDFAKKIIKTKKRAHNFNYFTYELPVNLSFTFNIIDRIKARPTNNLEGLLFKYTVGIILWFFSVVRRNLGYSIALGIYSPFTYYFITQPMNPHAMWAVGKIRNAYIESGKYIEESYNNIENKIVSILNDDDQNTLVQASNEINAKLPVLNEETKAKVIDRWNDRMSSFKAMQIDYEENMEVAPRMGRIEQMETQLNFPLIAESTWAELTRYQTSINSTLNFNTNLDLRLKNYLNSELQMIDHMQLYVWKKMAQFLLDHPYMTMDMSEEQPEKDYYNGRAFIFMHQMTQELMNKNAKINIDEAYAQIESLAKFYDANKIATGNIVENLKKNSKVFKQNDIYDTDELRSYMKRHWEVLYLQTNKAQEASNHGLQAYVWSVRNAIWIFQSLISAKREELGTLSYKFNLSNQNTDTVVSDKNIDGLYESLLHMLVLEYTSIKKEIAEAVNEDSEVEDRRALIEEVKESLNQREKLFNHGNPNSKTAGI